MFCCYSKKAIRNKEDPLGISIHNNTVLTDYNDESYLVNVKYEDTIPYVHPIDKGKVIKVYDGDTITIASKISHVSDSPIYRFSVRLRGIDSPEIKSKYSIEKELAKKSQKALSDLILGKVVYLKDVGMDKYGRVLANVYVDQINISQWMLQNRYAVEYDGGTKNIPEDWKIQNTI